jgi:hypothetical protein
VVAGANIEAAVDCAMTAKDLLLRIRAAAAKRVLFLPHPDYAAVVTAYLPDSETWEDDGKTRRKR